MNFIRICVKSNQESSIHSSVKDTQAHFDNIYLIFLCDVLDEHFHSDGIIGCFEKDAEYPSAVGHVGHGLGDWVMGTEGGT